LLIVNSRIEKIHSDDLESFKKEANKCKLFECVNKNAHFITLKYGDKFFRVKCDLFKNVPAPKFHVGQKVEIENNSNSETIIFRCHVAL
jgi:hypothetical protein